MLSLTPLLTSSLKPGYKSPISLPALSAVLATAAILCTTVPAARAQVTGYQLVKSARYTQTSSLQPVSATYDVQASLFTVNSSDADTATITAGTPLAPFSLGKAGNVFDSLNNFYPTEAAMDAAFPNATTYTYAIAGGTLGSQSANLTLPAATLWPGSVPYLTGASYASLQGMNANQDITLNISSFVLNPGANQNSISYSIFDPDTITTIFQSGSAIFNTPTSVTLPSGALQSDHDYIFHVAFFSLNTTMNAAFSGNSAFARYGTIYDTQVAFHTAAITTAAPESGSVTFLGLGFAGMAGTVVVNGRRRRAMKGNSKA